MKVFPFYDLSPFASTDAGRPAINAVHFRPDRLEATDELILAWIASPEETPFPEVSLSAPEFGKACKLLRKPGKLALPAVTGAPATLEIPGAVAHLPVAETEFPNTTPIIPQMGSDRHTVRLRVSVLKQLVTYLSKHGEGSVTLHLPPDPKDLVMWEAPVRSGSEKGTVLGVFMPAR